jgi:hypothetical protein
VCDIAPCDTNTVADVYLHDRDYDEDGVWDHENSDSTVPPDGNLYDPGEVQTVRVSERSSGGQAVNLHSSDVAISADSHLVAFSSRASNLVAGDTNDVPDVFVRDRLTGTAQTSVMDPAMGLTVQTSARAISYRI